MRAIRHQAIVLAAALVARGCSDENGSGQIAQEIHTVCASATAVRGIDVSVYQGVIDWNAAAAGGVRFATMRLANGTTVDTRFVTNWHAAQAAGVMRGAYQFFNPHIDPVAQANVVIAQLAAEGFGPGDLPPEIDVEWPQSATNPLPSPAAYANGIRAWMNAIRSHFGVEPIIYTGGFYWDSYVRSAEWSANPMWHAEYPNYVGPNDPRNTIYSFDVNPLPRAGCPRGISDSFATWSFWQFAGDNGRAPGVTGGVDVNVFNGTLDELNRIARVPVAMPEPPSSPVAGNVPPSVQALAAPARVQFVGPTRVFDTRTATESALLARSDGSTSGPISATTSGTVANWSAAGLPAGSTGGWLNLAAIGQSAAGFVRVYGGGQPQPPISNVNYGPGEVRSNALPGTFGAGGALVFETNVPTDLIADVSAAFVPTGNGLDTTGPTRVLDTRNDVALAGGEVPFPVDVHAPAGATGVAATIAVIPRGVPGFARAFPCGTSVATSNVTFDATTAVASNAIVSAINGGQLCLASNTPVDVVVDVTGYFGPTGSLSYVGLTPVRLLDTRASSSTVYTGRVDARQVLELPIQSLPGMPIDVRAVVANITTLGADGAGFVVAYACGGPVPPTSSLNFSSAAATGGLTVTAIGSGSLCVFASTRAHLIVDLLGVWTPTPGITPPDDAGTVTPMDSGVDAAGPDDAAVTADASVDSGVDVRAMESGDATTDARADGSTPHGPSGGCGCRTAEPRNESDFARWWIIFAAVAVVARRRRR